MKLPINQPEGDGKWPMPDRYMEINPSPATKDKNELREMQRLRPRPQSTEQSLAKGGKVKTTGAVKAHKGEHVIRKAAAQKYGTAKMAAINKGTAKVTAPKRK